MMRAAKKKTKKVNHMVEVTNQNHSYQNRIVNDLTSVNLSFETKTQKTICILHQQFIFSILFVFILLFYVLFKIKLAAIQN